MEKSIISKSDVMAYLDRIYAEYQSSRATETEESSKRHHGEVLSLTEDEGCTLWIEI